MIHPPLPAEAAHVVAEKNRADPPPPGYGWSVAWDRNGRRSDLDALVPTGPAPLSGLPSVLTVCGPDGDWLHATLPDDLAVPGVTDRLTAYLGTPHPERDA